MSSWSAGHCPRRVKRSALYGLRTAFLHATVACEEKWESKWKPGIYGPKNGDNWRKDYLNYVKRKRRAEAKRDLLKWYSMDISAIDFVEGCKSDNTWSFSNEKNQQNDGRTNSYRWSSKTGRSSTHKQHKSYQNWFWGNTWESFFHENMSWQERSSFKSEQGQNEKSKTEKIVGSSTDRQALGLSPSGPLTVEQLKQAFRLCALKWHPDRHQGSAKALAEAKFKHCGAAYKSLHNALAAA